MAVKVLKLAELTNYKSHRLKWLLFYLNSFDLISHSLLRILHIFHLAFHVFLLE